MPHGQGGTDGKNAGPNWHYFSGLGARKSTSNKANGWGELAAARLDQQMVVVVHQAVPLHSPIKALGTVPQAINKGLSILVITEDRLPRVATRHHVIEGTIELDSQRTGHLAMLSHNGRCGNTRPDPWLIGRERNSA